MAAPSTQGARDICAVLELIECDNEYEPDFRAIVRDERISIMCAVQLRDGARIAERCAEAVRVLRMWLPDHPLCASEGSR